MERGERLSPSSSGPQCCLLDLFASDGEDGAGGGVWKGGGMWIVVVVVVKLVLR